LYRTPVDLGVATFLGEAVVLPAQVRDGVAACALGQLAVRSAIHDGPAQALIRPEQLAIAPGQETGTRARVLAVTYYGKDAAVQLSLVASDTIVTARVPGHAAPQIGEQVTIRVQGDIVAYAA